LQLVCIRGFGSVTVVVVAELVLRVGFLGPCCAHVS
jgi:hypothetical protein